MIDKVLGLLIEDEKIKEAFTDDEIKKINEILNSSCPEATKKAEVQKLIKGQKK